MIYLFHPEAETEFYESINYYEECEEKLGYDFSLEVYSAIQKILDYPLAWSILSGDIRRQPGQCLLNCERPLRRSFLG